MRKYNIQKNSKQKRNKKKKYLFLFNNFIFLLNSHYFLANNGIKGQADIEPVSIRYAFDTIQTSNYTDIEVNNIRNCSLAFILSILARNF